MKLYAFDHCPFCVRVRVIIGLKKLPIEIKYLLQDDEETPIRLTGSRLKPFLEYEPNKFMRESLDIVKYLDEFDGNSILSEPENEAISQWIEKYDRIYDRLATPFYYKMELPEFSTESARLQYKKIHEKRVDNFETLFNEAPELLTAGQAALDELIPYINIVRTSNKQYGYSDIRLYPVLRHISSIPNIKFPAIIYQYLTLMSAASGIPTYEK